MAAHNDFNIHVMHMNRVSFYGRSDYVMWRLSYSVQTLFRQITNKCTTAPFIIWKDIYQLAHVLSLVRVMLFTYDHAWVRAVDKREYLVIIRDNFCQFCIKTYAVTPHLNRLDEIVR